MINIGTQVQADIPRHDWAMNLTDYLDNFKMHDANRYHGGYREGTVITYKKWLNPWVEFLNTTGNNVPTTQLLRQHL